jgi:hypothetical protein
MLLKLLKYELRASYARILAAFAVYTLIFLPSVLFFRQNELLLALLIMLGVVGLPVITFLTIFQRYNTNLYHSEGYLMFTLPVGGKKLLASKMLAAALWSLLLAVMSAAYLAVYFAAAGLWAKILPEVAKAALPPSFWLSLALGWVVSLFLGVLEIYFAISFSKLPVFRKFGVPVGFVAYFVLNSLPSVPVLLFGYFHPVRAAAATDGLRFVDMLRDMVPAFNGVQTAVNLVFAVGLFFATAWLLENKTSLR